MTQADLIIYGTLLTVSVLVGLIIRWGITNRRKQDAASHRLTAAEVRDLTKHERIGDDFLWCIWQDRLSSSRFKLHVRDQNDTELTIATLFHIPRGGIKCRYDINGRPRQSVLEGLTSNRTLLRDPSTGEVLMACAHEMRQERFFGPDLRTERFRLRNLALLDETRTLMMENEEIGKLFMVQPLDFHVLVLSVKPNVLTQEEQLFLLVGIRDS